MGFISRKGIFYKSLLCVILCLWLCGSDRVASSFKIYRSEHDIFTNLKCSSDNCTESQCEMYGAECVSSSNCKYCRCSAKGKNTFMSDYTDMDDQIHGGCKRDEEIVPESVPNEAFSLKNIEHEKCLKLESSSREYIIGTNCTSSPNPDMLWIWMWTASGNTRLMNVKTLQCMRRNRNDKDKVVIDQCKKANAGWQNIQCTEKGSSMEIKWNIWEKNKWNIPKYKPRFLYLLSVDLYASAIFSWRGYQQWSRDLRSSSKQRSCDAVTAYNGCYRFSDGSFMKYIYYSDNDTNVRISAPIFTEKNVNCEVTKLNYTRNGQEWEGPKNYFSISIEKIDRNTKKLQFNGTELFKALNGSLLKLFVSCGKEEHCVLLKLESKPNYSEVINSTPTPPKQSTEEASTEEASTLSSETTTEYDKDTTPVTKYPGGTTVITFNRQPTREDSKEETSTTANPEKGLREEASESGGTNTAAIAVPVTLLLIALVLALGFLVYYRRRKRAQVPQNSNNDTGVVNYSKEIYEDPDRTYETLKENENGVVYETLKQPGQPSDDDFYNYPDHTNIAKPPSSELEYTYAKDTDFPRGNPNTKVAASQDPDKNAVYHTLEQPGQPTVDDFYTYPDNTNVNIAKPPSSELEYTYAKDTDLSRGNANTRLAGSQDPVNNAVYETLEQPGQPNDDFYSYPENTNIAKPPSSELEYSYAKNTDIPTLNEQNPPQPPVYSTLEGPDDADNKQVTEERPSSNDHTYIDVIHDSNN